MIKRVVTANEKVEILEENETPNVNETQNVAPVQNKTLTKGTRIIRDGVAWIITEVKSADNTKMIRLVNTTNGDDEILGERMLLDDIASGIAHFE